MLGRWVLATTLATTLVAALTGCSLVPRPVPLARSCGGWSELGATERLQTAQALVRPDLMDRVRDRQHLPRDTPDADVYSAVAGSLTKTCELERRPELLLAEVVSSLYE
jgi:hypothetical protein